MTVEDIAAEAGVSRRTFYENFADKTDCFLAAYRAAAEELVTEVRAATLDAAGWEEQARRALSATLHFFATHVDVAHLAVIDVLAAGPDALAARDEAIRRSRRSSPSESRSTPRQACAADDDPADARGRRHTDGLRRGAPRARRRDRALQPLLTYLLLVPCTDRPRRRDVPGLRTPTPSLTGCVRCRSRTQRARVAVVDAAAARAPRAAARLRSEQPARADARLDGRDGEREDVRTRHRQRRDRARGRLAPHLLRPVLRQGGLLPGRVRRDRRPAARLARRAARDTERPWTERLRQRVGRAARVAHRRAGVRARGARRGASAPGTAPSSAATRSSTASPRC